MEFDKATLLKCQIAQTFITSTTAEQAVAFLRYGIINNSEEVVGKYVLNVSLENVMKAEKNEDYRKVINNAVMVLPNSHQLSMQMHSEGYPLAEKINIRKFIDKMFVECAGADFRHFFVFSSENDRDFFLKSVKLKAPGLCVAGTHVIDGNENDNALAKAAENIAETKANIVWVAGCGMSQAFETLRIAELTGVLAIAAGYGLSDWVKGRRVEFVGRITPGYIGMNLKYMFKNCRKLCLCTLSWLPALIVIIIIFALSSQNGTSSVSASYDVAKEINAEVSKLSLWGITWDVTDEVGALESLNELVRTLAHLFEYMVLSFTVTFAITVNGISDKIRFIITCLLGFCVAVLDEIYQIFIPDRYGDIQDIFCDSIGVLFVAMLIYVIGKKRHRKKLVFNNSDNCRRKFLNICVDDVTFDEALDRINRMASDSGKHYVITPNSDHVIKMEKDRLFRKILEDADLILTDGTPLMWIADSMGYPIREKIPGADMFLRVCEMAAKEGHTVFLLGAKPGVAQTAAEKLTDKYKGLKIVGTYSPELGFENDEEKLRRTIDIVNEKSADILVAALGSPKQEKFLYANMDRLNFHVALPFGAAVDFAAENVRRAPKWMRDAGFEWFFRFLQEPGRMFKRYFVDDMKIFYLAWKYRNEIIRLGGEGNNNDLDK